MRNILKTYNVNASLEQKAFQKRAGKSELFATR